MIILMKKLEYYSKRREIIERDYISASMSLSNLKKMNNNEN